MILSAHQPQFMPWLGYFAKMLNCDVFVALDDVQFKKNEWQNRNRIWSDRGGRWLTAPVLHKFPQNINDTAVNNSGRWKEKQLRTLEQTYSKAPGFPFAWKGVERFYSAEYEKLSAINSVSMEMLRGFLDVRGRVELSSRFPVEGAASLRLVNLCRKFGADTYLAGAGGRDYMDMELFERAGIKVVFQEFRHPVYGQFGGEFISNLSALDLVFQTGECAAGILKGASK
jgi:hypothetical protein